MVAIFVLYICTTELIEYARIRWSYNQISAKKKKSLVLVQRESAIFLFAEKGLYFNGRIYEYEDKVKLLQRYFFKCFENFIS